MLNKVFFSSKLIGSYEILIDWIFKIGLKISPKSSELTLLLIRGYIGQQNYGEATRVAK